MTSRRFPDLAAFALLAVLGCARLVTVEPETVPHLNDKRWSVHVAPVALDAVAAAPAAPDPASRAVVVPLPAKPTPPASSVRTPAMEQALRSSADGYGIPKDLYAFDPLLTAHRDVMAAVVRSHRAAGAGAIAFGLVEAGASAFLFWRASVNSDAATRARNEGLTVTSDPSGEQYVLSTLGALLAVGFFGYGIADLATREDTTSLRSYYGETYTAR